MVEAAYDALEVVEMDLPALRLEVDHWRESVAELIQANALELMNLRAEPRPWFPWSRRRRAEVELSLASGLQQLCGMLEAVLQGEIGDACGICALPMAPGCAVLREVDMGEVHAACLGEPMAAGKDPIRPGDPVQCDPEGIVDAHDEDVPGSDGVLVAKPHDPYWKVAMLGREVEVARVLAWQVSFDGLSRV